MVGSIKFFVFFKKVNQAIGFYTPQSNQGSSSLNPRSVILITSIAQFLFTSTLFIIYDAKTILDYGMIVTAMLCALTSFLGCFLRHSYEMESSLEFIEKCEDFFEKSKFCM